MAKKKDEVVETTQSKMKLTDLPGIGPAAEAKLIEAGYESVLSIAVASPKNLEEAAGISEGTARKVIKAARDSMNMGFTTAFDTETEENKRYKISTSSKAFDDILDGGIKCGGITIIYAEGTSGKTQLAHQLTANALCMRPTAKVVYIDTEGTFSPKRIRQMLNGKKLSEDEIVDSLKRIKHCKVHTPDHQIFIAEQVDNLFANGEDIVLVVVDSLIALFRSGFTGRGTLADRQQQLNKHLRTLQKIGDIHDIPVVVTNQMMSNPGIAYGNPNKPVGGHIVTHAGLEIISLTKNSKGIRTAKLVDSVYLGENSAEFIITENGIEDLV